MSLETVLGAFSKLIETTRKGPLIAILLLMLARDIRQTIRNEQLEDKLNEVQERRVTEAQLIMKEKNRTIELLDTIDNMKNAHINQLVELLKQKR